MPRSVILQTTVRCERCRFTPRWCICAGFQAVELPLQVDVMIHRREFHRPTSTGRLVNRLVPGSRQHLYIAGQAPDRATTVRPDRELWILHPRGEAMPTDTAPEKVQVLLLDGSWREAASMAQAVGAWGRLIRLPEAGPSRNALRQQENAGNYSTIESLLFLLAALGLNEAEARMRLQFELHVYAGLRTRGAKEAAALFLASSPIRGAFPELLARMHERRANLDS